MSNVDDYAAILTTLARYSTAMDTRDWRLLVRTDSGWRSRHRTLRLQYELGSREVLRPA